MPATPGICRWFNMALTACYSTTITPLEPLFPPIFRYYTDSAERSVGKNERLLISYCQTSSSFSRTAITTSALT